MRRDVRQTGRRWIMWPFTRKKESNTFDLAKVFTAQPKRTDLALVRRWGWLNNLGISTSQFNVYSKGRGYYLTLQDKEGTESEKLIHLAGGDCRTLMEAYMKATAMLTDLLIASQLVRGGNRRNLVVDTTPGHAMKPMAILDAEGNRASETRHVGFDELMTDGNASPPPVKETVDPARRWVVVDDKGQAMADFRVSGGRGKYELTGEWKVFPRTLGPTTPSSIEEAYDRVVEDIAAVIDGRPDLSTLFVADLSVSDTAALALGIVSNTTQGVSESRRYNPETLKHFAQPQTRLIRLPKNRK
jgi:hypothetical protein